MTQRVMRGKPKDVDSQNLVPTFRQKGLCCGHTEAHHVITTSTNHGKYERCRLDGCGCQGWQTPWPGRDPIW